jgi:large subunit ribosomal protein L15
LHRRLPKQRGIGVGLTARGFNTGRYKTHYSAVNLDMIALRFEAGSEVSPEALQAVGLISSLALPVKILSRGGVDKALTVRAHKFSAGAQVAITAAGGTVEVI